MGWSPASLAEAQAFSKSIGSTAVMIEQHGVVIDEWGDVAVKSPTHSVQKKIAKCLDWVCSQLN